MRILVVMMVGMIVLNFSAQAASDSRPWGLYADYVPIMSNSVLSQLDTYTKNKGGAGISSATGFAFGVMLPVKMMEMSLGISYESGKGTTERAAITNQLGTITTPADTTPKSFAYHNFGFDYVFAPQLTDSDGGFGALQLYLPLEFNVNIESSDFMVLGDTTDTSSVAMVLSGGLKLRTYLSNNLALDITGLVRLDLLGLFAPGYWAGKGANSDGSGNAATPANQTVTSNMTGWDVRAGLLYYFN